MTLLADVALPPVPPLDLLWLGVPWGLVAFVVAVGVAIGGAVLLRRRRVHGCLVFLAVAAFIGFADCGAWVVANNRRSEARHERIDRWEREQEERRRADAGALVGAASDGGAPDRGSGH